MRISDWSSDVCSSYLFAADRISTWGDRDDAAAVDPDRARDLARRCVGCPRIGSEPHLRFENLPLEAEARLVERDAAVIEMQGISVLEGRDHTGGQVGDRTKGGGGKSVEVRQQMGGRRH